MDLQEPYSDNKDLGERQPDYFHFDNCAFGLDYPDGDQVVLPNNQSSMSSQQQQQRSSPFPVNSEQHQISPTLNELCSTDNETSDLSSLPILSSNSVEFSPLPRRIPHPFGYADEPFVGRGHGMKIRSYSPTLREAGSSEFDDGGDDGDDEQDGDYKE